MTQRQRVENGFVIDLDVPVPDPTTYSRARRRYPWSELKVGESYFDPEAQNEVRVKSVVEAASRAGSRLGRKFITRSVRGDNNELAGVRIWRME